jgi:heptosyltransferase III
MALKNLECRKILLVRNDNIGDLVCSIPAIQLIRKHFPKAKIDLLVNSYNAPVVEPLAPKWVDRLIVYRKTKHVGLSFGQIFHLTKFYGGLSRGFYDVAVLLVGGTSRQARSFARWSGAKRIVGYGKNDEGPKFEPGHHEVEYSWNLAAHLCGVKSSPPPSIDYPIKAVGSEVGVQITSRKHGNRWGADRFVELVRRLHSETDRKPLLLWSPGDSGVATHPGDDEKAAEILDQVSEIVQPCPTATLPDLINHLKECRTLVTPDGGAMHLAAAMGVKIVAMFGQSEPERWRPWTPNSHVLQSPSWTIHDIKVDAVVDAWIDLAKV